MVKVAYVIHVERRQETMDKIKIRSVITDAIVKTVICPVKYCKAAIGEYCKTPNGSESDDLHKARYGKFSRKLGAERLRNVYAEIYGKK